MSGAIREQENHDNGMTERSRSANRQRRLKGWGVPLLGVGLGAASIGPVGILCLVVVIVGMVRKRVSIGVGAFLIGCILAGAIIWNTVLWWNLT